MLIFAPALYPTQMLALLSPAPAKLDAALARLVIHSQASSCPTRLPFFATIDKNYI